MRLKIFDTSLQHFAFIAYAEAIPKLKVSADDKLNVTKILELAF